MRVLASAAVAGLVLAGGSACAQAPQPVATAACPEDGAPQTGLPRQGVAIQTSRGPARFDVQVAADDPTRTKGLMFVKRMPDTEGMIFDFHRSVPVSFWMRNTYIPLDLLFVGSDGRIVNIARQARTCDESPIPAAAPVRWVIEINAGLSDRLGIRAGDQVSLDEIRPGR